jgi:hypothetical protein
MTILPLILALLSVDPSIDWMERQSNGLRAKYGRPATATDAQLCLLAQAHANKCATHGGIWHSDQASKPGTKEVVALTGTSNPFWNWETSDVGHLGDILSPATKAGYGAASDNRGWKYWVIIYRN